VTIGYGKAVRRLAIIWRSFEMRKTTGLLRLVVLGSLLVGLSCSPLFRGKGRLTNAEVVIVSFGSNNGEVAPCG
jgi:hypothetical protein